ncbi:hypothetical protein BDY19DRAFT_946415 [Irpex rosettiformis]|uniref:Uncharacterized protein n=1 Tax=Irpex rosettiformis TaxID=378272 RepID=A0ACB8U3H9_9APHY|nr:hypothetical protein BDY19DRAFT_946415 [Irpex rosettiformis]
MKRKKRRLAREEKRRAQANDKACEEPESQLFEATVSELEYMTEQQITWLAMKQSLTLGTFVDTKFYVFSRRRGGLVDKPLPIYANSTILKSKSTYFSGLFDSDFREGSIDSLNGGFPNGRAECTSEYDYMSDSDLGWDDDSDPANKDEQTATGEVASKNSLQSSGDGIETTPLINAIPATSNRAYTSIAGHKPVRVIVIPDVAFSTFNALMFFFLTGEVNFASLRSTQSIDDEASSFDLEPWEAPQCSPKSMYRLADKLGLSDLKEKAKKDIEAKLTPDNIMVELRSSFTSIYEEIRNIEVGYVCENDCLPSVLQAIPEWLAEHGTGKIPHSTSVITALFQNVCLIAMDS